MKKIINYSGIPVLVLIATLVFMPFSCSKEAVKENPLTDNSSQLIKVSGEDANAATKTTLSGFVTSWVASNDKVGIYSPDARTQAAGAGDAIVNAQFTAASSAVSSLFNGALPMYWGTGTATSHTFYAYYPFTAGSDVSTAVPVSLATAQVQTAANYSDISKYDFLVATPTTVTSPANTSAIVNEVNLKYNHLFTVLEFQIAGTGTSLGTSLKAIKLVGTSTPIAFSGGTINITQTTPATNAAYTIASQTGATTQAVVTLTNAATLTATNADTKVYMVINPGTQTGNCLIGLSSDGINYLTISKEAPSGGFLRGKKYVVAIDKATAVSTVPDAPIIGTATMGDAQARVTFTAPNNGGSVITGYTVTSSPGGLTGSGSGTASSIIVTNLINGTAYTFTVTATNAIGTSVASSASNSITPIPIPTVNGQNSTIWMDKNLGATRAAINSTDAEAYGDLYQWGRGADGHQSRTSGLYNTTLAADATSTSSTAWYGRFIIGGSDWLSPQNGNLWQGVSGTNNPCPSGFRLPTDVELNAERDSWGVAQNAAGAFASPLKFPVAGRRYFGDGSLFNVGSNGYYWSSTVDGTYSRSLSFFSSDAYMVSDFRAFGFSVRCIKD